MNDDTFLIESGWKSTITAAADVVGGFYQPLGNPGDAVQAAIAIPAGGTVVLGPYNEAKFFALNTSIGLITHVETFGGFADFAVEPPTTANGGAPFGATVTNEDTLTIFKRTVLNLVATPITITDDAGVIQYGGVKIYDFPVGHVLLQCSRVVGNLTAGVTGTIIPTFTGNVSLGTTVAVAGATLATTTSDLLLPVAMATAVASVAAIDAAPVPAVPNSGARWVDGRLGAKDVYLNFKIADDATHTSGTATFTGTVELIWGLC